MNLRNASLLLFKAKCAQTAKAGDRAARQRLETARTAAHDGGAFGVMGLFKTDGDGGCSSAASSIHHLYSKRTGRSYLNKAVFKSFPKSVCRWVNFLFLMLEALNMKLQCAEVQGFCNAGGCRWSRPWSGDRFFLL